VSKLSEEPVSATLYKAVRDALDECEDELDAKETQRKLWEGRALKAEAILAEIERLGTEPPTTGFTGKPTPGDPRGRVARVLDLVNHARSTVEQAQKKGGDEG
jgi:hypothetical protein